MLSANSRVVRKVDIRMIQDTTPVMMKPSSEGRLAKETAVYDLLEELHIS